MVSHQKKIQHLMLRAGFGIAPWELESFKNKPLSELVTQLFVDSEKYKDIKYLPYPLNEREQQEGAGGAKLVKLFFKSFAELEQLNEQWLYKMTHTQAVLREKMVFFWHNHFATSVNFGYLMQEQNNTIRRHALGNFGDLLHAMAKDPAMILYLNNHQNVKGNPNENFARELMELFTLGVGNYSEQDIKEAARAFTGWSLSNSGAYTFNPDKHDAEEKTFFGEKRNFSGEQIIDTLLKNKQTARFVTTKIYKEFVNHDVNKDLIEVLSDLFYQSNYDIATLMRAIFSASWFYDEQNIGTKIASPVELIVRFKKYFQLEFLKTKQLINYQKALGQVLFFPPNVAGWKGQTAWIDSASLLIRLSSISYINEEGRGMKLNAKPQFEEKFNEKRPDQGVQRLTANWDKILEWCTQKNDQQLCDFFIQTSTTSLDLNLLSNISTRDKVVRILTFPEFQLL